MYCMVGTAFIAEPLPLDSGFRRNDGVMQVSPRGEEAKPPRSTLKTSVGYE